MVRKLAIDWDERELRLVAAQCSGSNVKITDARVIPIEDNVLETLKAALDGRGMENTETLVAIGRGQAELRELQLPPVPEDELPDMVRFQAGKSFATAGDNANVDYLVTNRSDSGVEMIAAALGDQELASIRSICESGSLVPKRISIRPLSAAALYLLKQERSSGNDTVLIDLLSDEAEIVVARGGRVIFVRTVRMPSAEAARGRALAGELKRSLVACGSSGTLERVVLWGRAAVHSQDVEMLVEATDSKVEVLDPFSLVDVDRNTKANMPEHVGRLAPLVGLLVADEAGADRLLDFLNPRKRVEQVINPYRKYVIAGVPVAVAALVAFLIYRQLGALDAQIELLKTTNNQKEKGVKAADVSIARTEMVDKYLDGDVNWLNEIRRLAVKVPESDKLIVRSLYAVSDTRNGGGSITVEGSVTKPSVIEEFEGAVRDDFRSVQGDGTGEVKSADPYRWSFTETIKVAPNYVRDQRYIGIRGAVEESGSTVEQSEPGASEDEVVPAEAVEAEQTEVLDGQNAEREADAVPGTEAESEAEDASSDGKPPTAEDSGESESDDNPAESGAGKEPETSPKREPEANADDDDVVVEIRTEVKS
jgi:Tfp pilus assembly PilM family ATPase